MRIGLALVLLVAALAGGYWISKGRKAPELTAWTKGSGQPLTPEQQSVTFNHADLTFVVHPDDKSIEGRSILDLAVNKPIDKIQVDLDRELPISRITVNGQQIAKDKWSNPEGRVTIALPARFNPGQVIHLGVDYSGRPHVAINAPWDGGFVWSKTPQGAPWIATAVEGEGCDLFWPCFDNSLVEVGTVDLHIDVPRGLVAPSNGRFLGATPSGKDRMVWNWRAKNPNNYAIALNIAPYSVITSTYKSRFGNTIPLYYWYLPGEDAKARLLFSEFKPTLEFFERTIGPYPWGDEKVGVVETPHLGMEHQTVNAYGNEYKPAPEGFDWLFQHEFSHEWFGNQLTNRDWDDMWLHEGFGTYMQPLYVQYRLGQMPYDAYLWKLRAMVANKYPIVSGHHQLEDEVYDPKTGPANDIYYKAALMLHTLRGLIGDTAFFNATRRMVYGRLDPKPGNFTTRFGDSNEFIRYVNEESGRNLNWFFDVYLRSAHLPRLVTSQQGDTLNLQWQTQGGKPFPMPVEVAVNGQVQTVPMSGGHGSIALPADAHFVIDPVGKILRDDPAMDRFRDWTAAQKPKKS
jgi:aminopeptidase N